MVKLSRRNIVFTGSAGIVGLMTAITTAQAQTRDGRNQSMNSAAAQQALARMEIIETVNKIGLMADLRNWTECRACFSNEVEFDYTSLIGGQPTTVNADTQIQQWKDFFTSTFKTTQHLIGSHAVTLNGDTATCISHFQAHHVFLDTNKGKTWTLGGTYHHELSRTAQGWKVTKMKMTALWQEGTSPFS
jgi:ketosteroid isomerase-like protein